MVFHSFLRPPRRVASGGIAAHRVSTHRVSMHTVAPDGVATRDHVRAVVAVGPQYGRQPRWWRLRSRLRRRLGGSRKAHVERGENRLEIGRTEVPLVAETLDADQRALAYDSVGGSNIAPRAPQRLLQLARLLPRESKVRVPYAEAFSRPRDSYLATGLLNAS